MAEEQKTVEVPKDIAQETAPVVDAPVEIKPVEETAAPVTEDKPAEESVPAETTEAAKAEVKPVEEGHLGHKAQGLSFPKNLIASKEYFFFGSDAWEPKSLVGYQRSEKTAATAHANVAWASHTGKGLLFVGDKKSPTGIINLSDASEPVVDGANKFSLTSKGNKHSFKAANAAERDNWVSQLKLKIAEAKELQPTVVESETYKNTIESFKPAPVVKKEERTTEEAPKEEVVAAPVAEEAPKTEEAPKEEEAKVDGSKARSSSRKRRSFFGFGGKDEKKEETKEEKKEETKPEEAAVPAAVVVAPEAVVPAVVAEDKPAETEEAAKAEEAPKEEATTPVEEKPAANKRNSFFGGVFGKKEKKAAESKPTEAAEETKDAESAVAGESAPVIPPVETTTPLTAEVASPANVPTETVDVTPATNGDSKKDIKEKRKSSLPFAFGKREKSPAPVEGEKKSDKSPFSKLRATIKGKSAAPKSEDKPAEEDAPAEAPKDEVAATEEVPKAVEPVEENKPENVAATTPAVTAAA